MPRTRRASPWTVAEAQAALRALRSSGLSVRSFAQREGTDEERLYRWRRYFARASKGEGSAGPVSSPALIELRPSARRAEVVEIVLAAEHNAQSTRRGGRAQLAAREPGILLARADSVVERGAKPVAGFGRAADDQPARTKSRPRALRSRGRVTLRGGEYPLEPGPNAVSSTSSTTRRSRVAAAARCSPRASRGFCSRVLTRW